MMFLMFGSGRVDDRGEQGVGDEAWALDMGSTLIRDRAV
jgi:hypothetical protein